MPKITMTPHARSRTLERISKMSIGEFLKGVEKGVTQLLKGPDPWAIRVEKDQRVIGYAVGKGLEWKTTLTAGQQPDKWSQVVVVRL